MSEDRAIRRIHLDPIGGLAGDMFVAAVADAFPQLVPALLVALRALPLAEPLKIEFQRGHSGAIGGQRFVVERVLGPAGTRRADPEGGHLAAHLQRQHAAAHDGSHRGHDHRAYRQIRAWIEATDLPAGVKRHAQALFALLAQAEGAVHGIDPDEVTFHEVGAWDSIVDFVAAAWLIEMVQAEHWTWSPLPLGSGRVRTAHGILPVPAPATAILLQGIDVIDDGVAGERVTPTGAAIVRHLAALSAAAPRGQRVPEAIRSTGFGLGSRTLPGMPNATRCIAFAAASGASGIERETIGTVQFEIDDQPAEDLALGLERVRAMPGVLEVYQSPIFGKKGRLATQVLVLALPDSLRDVAARCFEETTTLGLRVSQVERHRLERRIESVHMPQPVRVKLATRPSGDVTAKAEMDDIAAGPGSRAAREALRRRAERKALAAEDEENG